MISQAVYYGIILIIVSVVVFILWNLGIAPAFKIVHINIGQAFTLGITFTLIKVFNKV